MIGPCGARDRRPSVLRAGSRPRGRVQLAVLPRRPQGGEAAEVALREMGTHEWGECCSTRGGPGGRAGARDEEDLGWRSRRREGLRCGRGRAVSGWWSWRGPRGVAAVAVATWRPASHAVTGPALAAPCDPQRPATAPGSPAALRGEPDAEEGAAGSDREGGVWGGTRRLRPRASGASGRGSASGGFRGARTPGAGGAGAGAPPLGEDALCATIGSCQPPRVRLCSSQPRFPHRRRGQSPLRYLPPGILVGIEAMSPFRAGTFTAIQTCSATAWDSQAPGSPTLVVGSKVRHENPNESFGKISDIATS